MSDLYNIHDEPDLRNPVLILAMSGWVDAGGSGTAAARFLADQGNPVATFHTDAIFDYRANRPTVRFRGGRMTDIEWPELAVYHRKLEERDLLILVGSEPDFQWKAVAQAVTDLMERMGVDLIVTIGAVPAAVPHTLLPPVMMTASSDELVGSDDVALGDDLDVPGAAVNVIAAAAVAQGMGTIGYWAQIPHYVNEQYHAGALALIRRVALRLEIDIDTTELVDKSAAQSTEIDELIAARPESAAHVQKLEMLAEEGRLASGDELAAEIERFLSED